MDIVALDYNNNIKNLFCFRTFLSRFLVSIFKLTELETSLVVSF